VFLDKECITFPAAESKGKRYPRTIYLHGYALEITQKLVALYPEGKFMGSRRKKDSISCKASQTNNTLESDGSLWL